jgi:tetratricopeptide (TPR) repeat protein
MCRFARLLSLAVCVTSLTAAANPWLRMKSPNFELFTTAGERSGRDLLKRFEQVRTFFIQATGAGSVPAAPARIIAFRSDQEFDAYAPNAVAAAYYQPGFAHEFIVMKRASSEFYPVAAHEYCHLIVRQSKMELPLWLNEGMAELYSTVEAVGSNIVVGKAGLGRLHAFDGGAWIDLRTLAATGHESPLYNEKERAGLFYAESWALTHMLVLDNAYRRRIKEFLGALANGGDAAAAFRLAYGKPLEEVQKDLHAYVRSDRLNAAAFNLHWDDANGVVEVETNAEWKARLALAELLTGSRGRTELGLEEYKKLALDYPDKWEIQRDWAEASLQHGRREEALPLFARALELGCRDGAALLDYGRALLNERRQEDAVRVLEAAVRVDPENGAIRQELGIALVRAGKYREALEQMGRARSVKPDEAARFFYYAAYAHFSAGELDAAREALAKGKKYAKESGDARAIESLEDALKERELAAAKPAIPEPQGGEPAPAGVPPIPAGAAPEPDWKPRFTAHGAPLPADVGELRTVECSGATARLNVRVEGANRVFEIPDPKDVIIRGASGETVEFSCGPQKARRVRIEYEMRGPEHRVIRTLEFM